MANLQSFWPILTWEFILLIELTAEIISVCGFDFRSVFYRFLVRDYGYGFNLEYIKYLVV